MGKFATIKILWYALVMSFRFLRVLKQFRYPIPSTLASKDRLEELAGTWVGKVYDIDVPSSVQLPATEFNITFEIKPGWLDIHAESTYRVYEDKNATVNDYVGWLYHDRYLILLYRRRRRSAIGFGAIILTFNEAANRLTGRAVGYGENIESLFFSKLNLQKASQSPSLTKNP